MIESASDKKIMVIAAYTPKSKKNVIESFLNSFASEFKEVVFLTRSDAGFDFGKRVITYIEPLPEGAVNRYTDILLFFAETLRFAIDCCRLVGRHSIDFCLSFWTHWQTGISLLLTKYIRGTPYVLRIAGPSEIASLGHVGRTLIGRLTNTLIRKIVSNSVLTISISQQLKSYIEYEASSGRKTVVIPYGIDTSLFRPGNFTPDVLVKYGVPMEKKLILYAGRVVKQKGIDYLIDAAPRVLSEMKSAHFVVVGDGPHLKHMMKRALEMDLREHITFTGPVSHEKMPSFYNACAIFILPSLTEGVPRAALEAMACSVPTITTWLPWTRGLISHKKNGYLIPPRDSNAVAYSILELLSNEKLAKDLGSSARNIVVKKYNDTDLGAKAIATIIQELRS